MIYCTSSFGLSNLAAMQFKGLGSQRKWWSADHWCVISEILMSQMWVHWLQETSEQNGEYHHHQAQCSLFSHWNKAQPEQSATCRVFRELGQFSKILFPAFTEKLNSCDLFQACEQLQFCSAKHGCAFPNSKSFNNHKDELCQILEASTLTRMCFTNIRGYQESTATITLRWQTNKYCQSGISVCNRAWT
jgi:hypothetical protein